MQLDTPCSTTRPQPNATTTPTATLAPTHRRRWTRLFKAIRRAILSDPNIRQLPIGHPDALVDRPGERRIVFGHNVLIVREPSKD